MTKRKTVKMKKTTPRFTLSDLKAWTGVLTAIAVVILLILVLTGKLNLQKIKIGDAEVEFSESSPTLEIEETPTLSVATSNPSVLETSTDLYSDAQQWESVVNDSFDSNILRWPEQDREDDRSASTSPIIDGHYLWSVTTKSDLVSVFTWPGINLDEPANFYVAVNVQNMNKIDTNGFGLTFRDQGADGKGADASRYSFLIYPDQHYVIRYKDKFQDGYTVIGTSSTNENIRPFGSNRIAIIGTGSKFWFYINGILVDYRTHDKISTGGFGFVITVKNGEDEAVVEFDNFELRKAP